MSKSTCHLSVVSINPLLAFIGRFLWRNAALLIYGLLFSISMSSITRPDSHAHFQQVQAPARAQKHVHKWLRTTHQHITTRQRSICHAIIDRKELGWQTESNNRLVFRCRKGGRGASQWDGCSNTLRVGARIVELLFWDWTRQATSSDKVEFFVMMIYCFTKHLTWCTPPDGHLQAIAKCRLLVLENLRYCSFKGNLRWGSQCHINARALI